MPPAVVGLMASMCVHAMPQGLLEEGEVHASVGAMVDVAGMVGEIVVATVFEYHETTFLESGKGGIGDVFEVLQSIGWVGKDDVKLLLARAYIFEYICLDGYPLLGIKGFLHLVEKLAMLEVEFYAHDLAATSTRKLDAYAAGASEEVEGGRGFVEVDIVVLKDVEESFFCKVCRRTCLEVGWGRDVTSLVFTSNYSHMVTC